MGYNMKKLIAVLAFTASFGASAGMPCNDMHEVATMIMKARQAGMSIPQLVETLEKHEFGFMQGLALYAYDTPRYSTESMKQGAISDFGNQVYIECKKQEETPKPAG